MTATTGNEGVLEPDEAGASSAEDLREEPSESAVPSGGEAEPRRASAEARLARLLGIQALVALLALSVFAAADSWNTVTGLRLAGLLCVVAGIVAGITLTTLLHEWFHFLGAHFSGGSYKIPTRTGLFLYHWDFTRNNVRQFFIMSIAGSVGGALAVILLWNAVPADSWGRAALQGAAIGSFVYAVYIEWPVLRRTRASGEPLVELSKIDKGVLTRSFYIASVVGLLMTLILAP